MSARVEAAAKVINARAVRPVRWDDPTLAAYKHNRAYDARMVLAAADSVMFSEAAVERAAVMLYEAAPYVRTLRGNAPVHWYSLSEDQKKLARDQARAVVAALREGA